VLPAPLANCFPSDDAEFTAAVDEALARSAELPIPNEELLERLEDALRDQYPHVRVQPRNPLAELGHTVWYVYRDGRAVNPVGEESAVTGSA
jgi:hypothetical protein